MQACCNATSRLSREIVVRNATFDTDEDFSSNACVGNNGWVDHATYSDGFDDAVIALCDTVFKGGAADTLIYPIVFCARHRIELFIKSQLRRIGHIKDGISIPDGKITKTHDLKVLWLLFKDMTRQCDRRYGELVDKCEPVVMDFFAMDPKGETFRYPYSKDGVKHLTEQSIIGLRRFIGAYGGITELMGNIEILSGLLYNEYSTKTYTKKLSRSDIEEVAKSLPLRSAWRDVEGSFDLVRQQNLTRYNIGSRAYSEVLNVIQSHREFSGYIGSDNSISHCDSEKLNELFLLRTDLNKWSHNVKDMLSPEFLNSRAKYATYINDNFSNEELATMLALYELGSSYDYYSERYDELYLENLKDVHYSRSTEVNYLVTKGGVEDRVRIALKKMSQVNILSKLTLVEKAAPSEVLAVDVMSDLISPETSQPSP